MARKRKQERGGGTRATVALEREGVAFQLHAYDLGQGPTEGSVGEALPPRRTPQRAATAPKKAATAVNNAPAKKPALNKTAPAKMHVAAPAALMALLPSRQ